MKIKGEMLLRILFYVIPFIGGMIYWLAFFPGVLSFDSVSQWHQLSTLKITDLHPAIHTILMWLLTRIWYSPAIISLFQVVFASLVLGYGLNSLRNGTQLPALVLVAICIGISVYPIVGIMEVTLWKDILYSYLVLLLTIFIFNILRSEGEWLKKPAHFVLLGIDLAFIWLLRFNGFPIVIASLIVLLLAYKKQINPIALSMVIFLPILLLVLGPVYSRFRVDRSVQFNYGIPLIHPVAPYVNTKADFNILSESEKKYLNNIYPVTKPWPYSCYDATVFYYDNANFTPVISNPAVMVKIYLKLAVHDPKIMVQHFTCLSSFVWQINQPRGVYLETVVVDNYDPALKPDWAIYKDVLERKSYLPAALAFLKRAIDFQWNRDVYKISWRPAIYMYLFLASLAFFIIRTKLKVWWLLAVPMLAQTLGIMVSTQLQALRYQYPIYLISMLFTIPMLIMGWVKSPHISPTNRKI